MPFFSGTLRTSGCVADHYRPQTKLQKSNFLQLSVILFTEGRCTPSPPRADTLLGRHPPGQTPPQADTLLLADTPKADSPAPGRHPPPGEGHCSGRSASYWSVLLLSSLIPFSLKRKLTDGLGVATESFGLVLSGSVVVLSCCISLTDCRLVISLVVLSLLMVLSCCMLVLMSGINGVEVDMIISTRPILRRNVCCKK